MSIRKLALLPTFVLALVAALLLAPGAALANEPASTGLAAGSTNATTSDTEAKVVTEPQVRYKAYVGSQWTNWKKNGATTGTKNKKFQMVRLKLAKSSWTGKVKYRIYQRGKGWSKWAANGTKLGTKGWYMRGIQIKLTGKLSKRYDIVYRVYVKGQGWQPWTTNGGTAGSTGKLGTVQMLKVKLVAKGSSPSVASGAYFLSAAKNLNATVQLPDSSNANDVQMKRAPFSSTGTNLRFFVRKQTDGTIALQSCASGLYLYDAGGVVAQRPDGGTAQFRWKLSTWRAGLRITNVQTGANMKISGGKLITAAGEGRFVLTRTDALADGTYTITSAAKGTLLAVVDESNNNGAKLWVQNEQETNAEVFKLIRTATDTYRITNVSSGKRMEVENGSNAENATVWQNAASGTSLQKWRAVLQADGTYSLINKASGKVLTASGSGTAKSYAQSSADTGAKTQRWIFTAHKAYQQSPQVLAETRAAGKAKNATSATSYLITVDLTHHWLCIFEGSKGNWTLYKSWICSTGAPGMGTPTGDYTTGYKQYSFGSGYTVYYATAFIGYEYLFHSIKYNEGTFAVQDGRLGQSVSEGCVRLSLANAKWIYNNIPSGTKVKIYY